MAKKLSPMEQRASSKVLDALRGETQNMLKGKMDGLKKVTVASDSKEGLKKGLDLAKKIAGTPLDEDKNDSIFDEADETPEEESAESPEEETSEQESGSEVSPEEEEMDAHQLQKRIEALMALKSKKQ